MRTNVLILVIGFAVVQFVISNFGNTAPAEPPKGAGSQAESVSDSESKPRVKAAAGRAIVKAREIYRELAPYVEAAMPHIEAACVKLATGFLTIVVWPAIVVDRLVFDIDQFGPFVTDLFGWRVPTPAGCLVFGFGWLFWLVVPVWSAKAVGAYDPFDSLFFWRPVLYGLAARLRETVIIANLFGKQATGDWANWVEILSNRYVEGDVFLGRPKYMLRPIGLPTEKHMLIIAGTGSGKTTGALIPNVILHKGSLLCVDPKGEIAMITAARRRKIGGRTFILDPFKIVPGESSASYNVFDELSRVADVDPDAVFSYAGKIAQALVKPMSRDTYWDNAAITFLTGLILYILANEPEERRNLVRLRQLLMEGDVDAHAEAVSNGTIAAGDLTPFEVLLEKMIASRKKAHGAVIAGAASSLKQMGPNQMGGVVTSAQEQTSFLDSPSIQRISLKSDFVLARLKNRRTSVFLCLPINAVHGKEGRWLRMFVMLFVDMMTREQKKPKDPILLAIDEFPSLGRLDGIETVAPIMRSYGVRFLAAAQDIDQLAAVYPDCWEGFIGGAEAVQFMGIKHAGTVRFISQLIGNHVVEEMDEVSGRKRRIERPVIEPNQISRLLAKDQGMQIIWRGDKRPMLLKITPYYSYMPDDYYTPDPRFKRSGGSEAGPQKESKSMSVEYMKLLVHCSRRKGRAFQMEVAVAPNNALVTRVEALPDGYEEQLRQRRNPQERRVQIPTDLLNRMSGARGCPFCGQGGTFHCQCGRVSCKASGDTHHYCEGCQKVYEVRRAETITATDSGFLDGVDRLIEGSNPWVQYLIPDHLRRLPPAPLALEEPEAKGASAARAAMQYRLQQQLAGSQTRALPAPTPRQIEAPQDQPQGRMRPQPGLPARQIRGLLPPADSTPPVKPTPKLLPPASGTAAEIIGQQPTRRWSADLDPNVAAHLEGKTAQSKESGISAGPNAEWPPRPSGRLSGQSDQPGKGPRVTPAVRTRKFADRPRKKSTLEKLADKLKGLIE